MSRKQGSFSLKRLVSIGNYRLHEVHLGSGSFATVELARHALIRRYVALKLTVKKDITDSYVERNL